MKRLSLFLILIPLSLSAYQIFLDIDLDDDPTTLNETAPGDTALVRMVLAPENGSEWIHELFFGLGGTCWMCYEWYTFTYGTGCELFDFGQGWLDGNPLFADSFVDCATCSECCGNPGAHFYLFAYAADGGFLLEEAIFIRDFLAWRLAEFEECPRPPPDLMAFACGGACNSILLSTNLTSVPESGFQKLRWDCLKSLY